MDRISNLLEKLTPFIVALTPVILVAFQYVTHRNVQQIKNQTNGMSKALQDIAQEKGRSEESIAAAKGETTVGKPMP